MKVLVFSSLYPNNVTPRLGVFIKERMVHFTRLTGNEVQVVAPVPYFPPVKISSRWQFSQIVSRETIDGVEVYHPRYFMTPKVGMAFYGWTMFLSVLPMVRRLRKHYAFDLIDAHFMYPDGMAATLIGRFLGIPVVVSARGSDILLYSQFATIHPLLRKTLQTARETIAVSQELKASMVRLGAPDAKVTVIPNGVDPEKFHAIPREEARRTLGLSLQHTILSVGNLTLNKGFDRVLIAFRNILAEEEKLRLQLVIAGEGPFRKNLEEMSASFGLGERVQFVGNIPHLDLAQWYSAADVFCLFSRQEGCPNVVLESLACGTPVVATPVGEIPYIISSEEIGFLAKPNEQEMTRQLVRALKKPWSREAIQTYAKEYSWERVVHSVEEVFQSALGSSGEVHIRRSSIGDKPQASVQEG